MHTSLSTFVSYTTSMWHFLFNLTMANPVPAIDRVEAALMFVGYGAARRDEAWIDERIPKAKGNRHAKLLIWKLTWLRRRASTAAAEALIEDRERVEADALLDDALGRVRMELQRYDGRWREQLEVLQGHLLVERGRSGEAREVLADVLTEGVKAAWPAALWLADDGYQRADWTAAERWYTYAEAGPPNISSYATYRLAWCDFEQRGNPEVVFDMLKVSQRIDPDSFLWDGIAIDASLLAAQLPEVADVFRVIEGLCGDTDRECMAQWTPLIAGALARRGRVRDAELVRSLATGPL